MQQVLVIHGGDAFETQEEYLKSLHQKEISLERMRTKDWKGNLGIDMGERFDVLVPRMPNAQNARYQEWKIIFDKIAPLLDDDVILIGHSLGGIFLAKYLTQNTFPKKVKATFLVAAPFNTPDRHPLVDFTLTSPLEGLARQGGRIFIYHSKDDKVVSFANATFYLHELPNATLREFADKGHFNIPSFPELVTEIKAVSS